MIRVLAIDTSSHTGSTALVERDPVSGTVEAVAELGVSTRDSHGVHLPRRVELLLAEAGWSKTSLDAYAAVRGPGSFTGIRIGLGIVRGLALATGRPAVGVTSLEAMVEAHGADRGERVALLPAGRGELYGARFDSDGSPPGIREDPWLAAVDLVPERAAGAAVWIVPEVLSVRPPDGIRLARPASWLAAPAGRVALLRWDEGKEDAGFSPLYIRPPDAELNPRFS